MENIETQMHDMSITSGGDESSEFKWDWPLKELYRSALAFYKGNYSTIPTIGWHWPATAGPTMLNGTLACTPITEKSGKAVQFTYEDNLRLVAFCQQALHGPVTDSLPPIGAFDVIGRDRRLAWQQLGTISKSQAMEGFVDSLDRLCPSFRAYIEAIKRDREEKERAAHAEEQRQLAERELERQRDIDRQQLEEQRSRDEMQKRKLQDALNQQTYLQFRAYAEKQYPGNPEQQAVLIRQLQNEHYHQYMQQLHAQMATTEQSDKSAHFADHIEASEPGGGGGGAVLGDVSVGGTAVAPSNGSLSPKESAQLDDKEECDTDNEDTDGFPPIAPPNMWTKPDIELFKTEVAAGKGEGVIRVSSTHGAAFVLCLVRRMRVFTRTLSVDCTGGPRRHCDGASAHARGRIVFVLGVRHRQLRHRLRRVLRVGQADDERGFSASV